MNRYISEQEITGLEERLKFWESSAIKYRESSDYYRQELTNAHALLGRVIHQLSELYDSVNLTAHFPTDNRNRRRGIQNPKGRKSE